jgi:hypothetical protein
MKEFEYPYLELLYILEKYIFEEESKIQKELIPEIKSFEEKLRYKFNLNNDEKDKLLINIDKIYSSDGSYIYTCVASNFFTASILFGDYIPYFMIDNFVENNILINPKTNNKITFAEGKYHLSRQHCYNV